VLEEFVSLADFEARAEHLLPRHLWDYIAGASEDERVARRNLAAFEWLTLRPRILRGAGARDLSTTVLGTDLTFPVMLSPAAFQSDIHPDGELATTAGGARAGVLTVVPSLNGRFDEVAAAAPGPLWLQIYHAGRAQTEALVRRAEASGYRALCLTADVPVPNTKERDRRNGFLPPYTGVTFPRHLDSAPDTTGYGSPVTLADLEWLVGLTSLPVVLKGVMTAEDARIAADSGAAGLIVSNHGGRLLDSTVSSLEALPEIVEAVAGQAEVYLDGGVRRGSDVLKALALGARAVAIGRPWYWGLAVGGADGVHAVLEILRRELDTTLALCGQTSVLELDPGLASVPEWWARRVVSPL
jgi:4-hydroxymandelate oxidase